MSRDARALAEAATRVAEPFETASDLDATVERAKDARVVLLGEATHGTAEFYEWRREITLRLARDHGFSFVAVEGDWPDCARLDRYVKAAPDAPAAAEDAARAFDRWPTWMWANRETVALAEALRRVNDAREGRGFGFYGLDVYSLWDSMRAVVSHLRERDPRAAEEARRAYACFDPYAEDAQAYAASTRLAPETCEDEVVEVLAEMTRRRAGSPSEERFDAEQNALVARNAERYYRAMVRGGALSWNVRDVHMLETLARLLDHHGADAKAVVWAHNTHVGDARATDMADDGMVNLGQLARERWGRDDVFAVGFGTHRGTVVAARAWEAPMMEMTAPPAAPGSLEDVLHRAGGGRDLVLLVDASDAWRALRGQLGHRAIGVVYRPEFERHGNYVPTVLPERYDAFVFLDRTRALSPLHDVVPTREEPPETYPSGF